MYVGVSLVNLVVIKNDCRHIEYQSYISMCCGKRLYGIGFSSGENG